MKEQIKLLPCPFCGNEDIEIEHRHTNDGRYLDGYMIYCCMCDVEMTVCGDECASHKQDAIDQWNTRTQSRPLKCEVDMIGFEGTYDALNKLTRRKA